MKEGRLESCISAATLDSAQTGARRVRAPWKPMVGAGRGSGVAGLGAVRCGKGRGAEVLR